MRWISVLILYFVCTPVFGQYGYDYGYYGGGMFGGFFSNLFGVGYQNAPYYYPNTNGSGTSVGSSDDVPADSVDSDSNASVRDVLLDEEADEKVIPVVDDGEVDMDLIKSYEGIVLPPPPTKVPRFRKYWY